MNWFLRAHVHRCHVSKIVSEVLLTWPIKEVFITFGFNCLWWKKLVIFLVAIKRPGLMMAFDNRTTFHWAKIVILLINISKLSVVVSSDYYYVLFIIVWYVWDLTAAAYFEALWMKLTRPASAAIERSSSYVAINEGLINWQSICVMVKWSLLSAYLSIWMALSWEIAGNYLTV